MEKQRCGQITFNQKESLVAHLTDHPELKSGKFTKDFTFKKAQELWEGIAQDLNAMPGANKHWKQWRKTWQDLRCQTKKKASELKRSQHLTGGGPALDVAMDETNEKILDLIGPIAIDGHPDTEESYVDINLLACNVDIGDENSIPTSDIIVESSTHNDHSYNNITDNNNRRNVLCENNRSRKPTRIKRLENTISATQQLSNQMEKKISLKEKYYELKSLYMKKKIEHLDFARQQKQKKLENNESIANSLKLICEKFTGGN